MRKALFIVLLCVAAAFHSLTAEGQFKKEAFSQSYNDDNPNQKDTANVMFSFPEFFGGLKHTREARIGTMFAGSAVLVGAQQIYNEQYWKLPISYAAIGSGVGAGIYFSKNNRPDIAKWCYVGAGVAYWATLFDGVANYQPSPRPYPGKATIFSILCPGLGQAYNGEYWKIPIYVGGLVCAYHFYDMNTVNFNRFRNIYKAATATPDTPGYVPYDGPISAETAKYYRDIYRTYRDYSIIALALVYLIQVMDANVFAYMHDFEVTDDIALKLEPAVIAPGNQFAMGTNPAVGASLRLRF